MKLRKQYEIFHSAHRTVIKVISRYVGTFVVCMCIYVHMYLQLYVCMYDSICTMCVQVQALKCFLIYTIV